MAPRTVIHWRGNRPVKAYYEAARPDPQRKQRKERGSADTAILRAGLSLREQARHLDQNHDLARGVLDVLVRNTVGHSGIGTEPIPRDMDGNLHKDMRRQVRSKWRDWERRPEVTWELDWPAVQRLVQRTRLRDGEALVQVLSGNVRKLDHGTRIPFSLELIEPDLLPMDFNDAEKRIIAGVEKNAWGRPVNYYLYREHPGSNSLFPTLGDMKRVPADRILHPRMVDRIGQTRGVTVFAPVMMRMDDIKDYEESERIAAKVAASMAAYIRKGAPDLYDPEYGKSGEPEPRAMRFRPGMVFDDLLPGEEIGTIDTSRPNTSLEAHRNGQLRAVAAGVGGSFSSISRDYNGTYSAQRQELVETWGAYQIMAQDFISQFVRPVYERWLDAAIVSGEIVIPADVDIDSLLDAIYIQPQMPWIDPKKEAEAYVMLESAGYISAPEIIRKSGRNPEDVLDQEQRWREDAKQRGLHFDPVFGQEEEKDQEPENTGDTNARIKRIV